MFYEKLRAIYAKLTYSETKIADYILANRENVFNMTSQQMADNLGVGQSVQSDFFNDFSGAGNDAACTVVSSGQERRLY